MNKRLAGIGALLVLPLTASAAIVATHLDARLRPPADVRDGETTSDLGIRAMNEAQDITLAAGTTAPSDDYGYVPSAGEDTFSCHLLHFDPTNMPALKTGQVLFSDPIMALVYTPPNLDDWDDICSVSGMVYPLPGDEPDRGMEASPYHGDALSVTRDANGEFTKLRMTSDVPTASDQVRVITCSGTCSIPDWEYFTNL